MSVKKIEIGKIIPTPDNPRRIDVKDPALKELADSIAASGQLQAGVGRPHPTKAGCIDLRAGCRRFEACRLAGLPTMDVNVIEMTDAEAMRVTVLENLQREELTPLEEARGISGLMTVGQSVEQIAAEMGKSVAWIRRRARLTKLTKAWEKLAEEYQLPAAVLELIARYDEAEQAELFSDYEHKDWALNRLRQVGAVEHFRGKLANRMHELRLAPWRQDDSILLPAAGACSTCQKRTDCQPDLFDEFATGKTAGARCLDAACWARKLAAHNTIIEVKLREKHPNLVTVTEEWEPRDKALTGRNSWDEVKKSQPGAVPALMVDGEKAGKLIYVLLRGARGAAVERKAKSAAGKGPSLAEKREQLERRRKALALDLLRDAIDRAKPPKSWTLKSALRALIVFGTAERHDHCDKDQWVAADALTQEKDPDLIARALDSVRRVLNRRLVIYTPADADNVWPDAENIAEMLHLDLERIKADADAEIPEPKSWAKLS